jgi:hypothetical protein
MGRRQPCHESILTSYVSIPKLVSHLLPTHMGQVYFPFTFCQTRLVRVHDRRCYGPFLQLPTHFSPALNSLLHADPVCLHVDTCVYRALSFFWV